MHMTYGESDFFKIQKHFSKKGKLAKNPEKSVISPCRWHEIYVRMCVSENGCQFLNPVYLFMHVCVYIF